MGVKIEVLFTKDTPYGDMLKKIEELAKEHMEPWLVPLPFLERIIETRGLTVIHYAIDDFVKIFDRDDTAAIKVGDMKRLMEMMTSNKLDEVWMIAHEMCAEPDRNLDAEGRVKHREKAQELRDWLNKHSPAKNSVDELNKMTDIIEGSDTSQLYKDLIASRGAAKTLLAQKQEPSSPMDIAAAKVLKEHQEAGTLDSTSDEELGQQVQDQYFKDWEASLEPQDAAAWDRASPLHIEHVSLRDTIKRMLQLRGLDGYLQNDGSIVLSTGEVKTLDELRQMPVTEPVGQMLPEAASVAMKRAEKNAYVRPIVVRVGEGCEKSDNYIACMAMLRAAMMAPSEVISDLPRVMKTLKGKCHPMDGFFIQMYDGTQITNWMQLSKWIDEKGLMPL